MQRLDVKENIEDLPIEDELKDSYLTYAMSVIVSRALPDVRDGLKPSQRRILVAMNDLGLGPRSRFRKCAKIVGDTSGNYHPHGEQVVYPTLVRLAQDFNLRYPLAQGQGNFGSLDGDPPAAMRYTEARLTQISMEMLEDLNQDTVDFVPNYDVTRTEPVVLPGKFPNLLCNGCSGIAVGMATSIPPQNLTEVCDGLIKVMDDPEVTIEELMKIIQGPDFPTGGCICGRAGIRDGYTTGRGIVTVRARVAVEETRGGKQNLVVTEIPYQVNKSTIKERIADAVNAGRVTGVSDVRDESGREGTRLVVELKRGEDETIVLNQLFKHTPLQTSFSIIMTALVNRRPRTLNLKEFLVAFKDHRVEVVRRRTAYLLARAERRMHILEGFLIALDNLDAVIALIRKSPDPAAAKEGLMSKFKLSDVQADAILQMQLQRLTRLERDKVVAEHKELAEEIKYYQDLLANEALVLDVIREDIYEIKEKYGDARRTEIIGAVGDFDIEDLIAEESAVVTISHEGYIKRMPASRYHRQHRGGKGIIGADTKEGDFIEQLFIARTLDYILFFTDMGRVYWLKVYDIPQLGRTSRGRAVVNILNLQKGENITSTIPVREFDDRQLVMVTERGVAKKTALVAYRNPQRGGIIAIRLDKKDKLIGVVLTFGRQELVLGTLLGKAIRFSESDLRSQGRATRGVKGIKLTKSDRVVGVAVVDKNATLLTVCEQGYGKRTDFEQYRLTRRGGLGIINIKANRRNGKVVGINAVTNDDGLMMITSKGIIIHTPVSDIRPIGRNTQGVRLINLAKGDKLVSVAKVMVEETEAEAEPDKKS